MKNYTIEEFAKYNTISVMGMMELKYGEKLSADQVVAYYEAMLKDLETGAMERSCKTFDKIHEARNRLHEYFTKN